MKIAKMYLNLLMILLLLLSGCGVSKKSGPATEPTQMLGETSVMFTDQDLKSEKAWRDLRFQEPAKGYLYPAKTNGKWGFINSKGDFVIQPRYDWVSMFNPSGTAVVGNFIKGAISAKMIDMRDRTVLDDIELEKDFYYPSNLIHNVLFIDFYETFRLRDGTNVVVDQTGKIVYTSNFELSSYGEGFVAEGNAAYVDLEKTLLNKQPTKINVPKKYCYNLPPFKKGFAAVTDKYGVGEGWIDRNGLLSKKCPEELVGYDEFDEKSTILDFLQKDSDDVDQSLKKDGLSEYPVGYPLYLGEGVFAKEPFEGFSEKEYAKSYRSSGNYVGSIIDTKTGLRGKLKVYLYQRFFDGVAAATDYKKAFFIGTDGKKAKGYPVFDRVGELLKIGSLILQNVHNRYSYYTLKGKNVFTEKDEKIFLNDKFGYIPIGPYRNYDFGLDYPRFFGLGNADVEKKINQKAEKMNEDFFKLVNKQKIEGYEVVNSSLNVKLIGNLLLVKYNLTTNGGGSLSLPFGSSEYFDIQTGETYEIGSMFKNPKEFKEDLVGKAFQLYSKKKLKSLLWVDGYSLKDVKGFLLDGRFYIYKDGIYITEFHDGSSNHLISYEKVKIPFSEIEALIDYESQLWKSYKKE